MNAGFILLYRQITEWEWYQNPNTFRVFLHCLLMANFTDGRFEGKEIKRGQFVTSLPNLAKQTKLSIRQVRVALDHLIMTGELTNKSYTKFRVITVVNYDKYQSNDRQIDSQMTDKGQTSDSQMTNKRQQYNNNNNGIMEKGNNLLPLMGEDEAHEIQLEQNRVLDAAEDAGFDRSNSVRAGLIQLYACYGLDKMLEGIKACVDHSAVNLAYLRAVLKGEKKPQKTGRVLPAQDFQQRDYTGVTEALIQQQELETIQRYKDLGLWDEENNCVDKEKEEAYEARKKEEERIKAEAEEAARKAEAEEREKKRQEEKAKAEAYRVCANCREAEDCAKKRFYEKTTGCSSFMPLLSRNAV